MASEGLWELILLANEAGVVAQSMCVGLGAGWGGWEHSWQKLSKRYLKAQWGLPWWLRQ